MTTDTRRQAFVEIASLLTSGTKMAAAVKHNGTKMVARNAHNTFSLCMYANNTIWLELGIETSGLGLGTK